MTSEAIDNVSAQLAAAMENLEDRREWLRVRLAAEEVLILWRDTLGENTVCTLWFGIQFGQRIIRLTASGPIADPDSSRTENELDAAGTIILKRLGLAPSFKYERGVNQVTLQLPAKKPNQLIWIGIAAVMAIVLGLLSLHLPADVRAILSDELASPALGMLLGALSGVAMPMIFFSICTSIMNIGDIATLGRIGKKFLGRYLGMTLVILGLTLAAISWLFPMKYSGFNGSAGFQTLIAMLFDVIPSNMVSPFLDGNVLQILFLGSCFGVAFLMLGDRGRLAEDAMKQLDQVVSLLMAGINRLLPVFVFLTLYTLAASGAIYMLNGTLKLIALVTVMLLLLMLALTIWLSLRLRVPVRILTPKMMPAFWVALSTASSMASYPLRLEICKTKLGIDERTAHFCVPLAQALFKPSVGVLYCCAALCIAEEYGVPITPGWLVLCFVVSVILTVATPPVPGGAKIAFAALFSQLGIPAEGVVLALAADTVLDFLWTASNTYVQMVLNVLCSDELGLVDRDVLAEPNEKRA